HIQISDYEVTPASLRLRLMRGENQSFLNQAIYLGSFEENNPFYKKTLIPLTKADLKNIKFLLSLNNEEKSDQPESFKKLHPEGLQKRLELFKKTIGDNSSDDIALEVLNTKKFKNEESAPFYTVYRQEKNFHLPDDPISGYGVLAPKSFKDAG